MTYFRLGMSESSLVFVYFVENNIILNDYEKILLINFKKSIINWFYTTSGFFDISIKGSYFDFNEEYEKIINSETYNNYFNNLLKFIKDNDFTNFYFRCHKIDNFTKFLPLFFKYINKENELMNHMINNITTQNFEKDEKTFYNINQIINNNLNNKKVLLIHNLSELMIEQYNNGNINKINEKFPKISLIVPLKIGYTFLNTSLDNANNIIERSKIINSYIEDIIDKYNIDFVIISCGAYSSLISISLHNKVEYCMIGGELEKEFGIITNRNKELIINKDHYINVPDKLKPLLHEIIENSCYW
jgi:hypothetical protein